MKVIVAMRQLADLVDELEVNGSGNDIDRDFIKFVSNEWDEAALEEALCLKEAHGGEVVVVALDEPDVDQTLFTALAKGADHAVKLTGNDPDGWVRTGERAARLAEWLAGQTYDLILTGVQAADDLDGQLAGVLGAKLGLPHAAVVVGVEFGDSKVEVNQELGGGTVAVSELAVPAVLGIQAARQAPRYAAITRIRQAMQDKTIEEVAIELSEEIPQGVVRRMYPPEARGGAEMLTGSTEEIADQIVELIKSKGLARV